MEVSPLVTRSRVASFSPSVPKATFLAVAFLLATVPATLPGPAGAFHSPTQPMVAIVEADDTTWAAWRIETPVQGRIEVEAQALISDAERAGWGVWILDEDGDFISWTMSAMFWASLVGGHVQVLDSSLPQVDVRGGGGVGGQGVATSVHDAPAGTYLVVAYVAGIGDIADVELKLWASSGTTVVGATQGTSAFFYREQDFDGLLNTFTDVPFAGQVQAMLDAHGVVEVEGRFFGHFSMVNTLNDQSGTDDYCRIAHQSPDFGGSGRDAYRFHNGSPGTYDFIVDRCFEVAQGEPRSFVWATGADVVLP